MGYQNPQKGHHPWPIVCSRGSVIYEVAKELANILRPQVGHFSHHIRISQAFVDQVKSISLEKRECTTSYDVEALFPICSSGPCHLHYQTQAGTGHTTASQNIHAHTSHHHTVRVQPQEYLFPLPK